MKNIFIKDKSTKIFYFRKVINKNLLPYFPQTKFFIKSLETINKKTALKHCKMLNVKYEYIKRHFNLLSATEIQKLVNELLNTRFDSIEEELYLHPDPKKTTQYITEFWKNKKKEYQTALLKSDYSLVEDEVNSIDTILLTSADKQNLSIAIMKSHIIFLDKIENGIENDSYQDIQKLNNTSTKTISQKAIKATITLSGTLLEQVINDYIESNKSQWKQDRYKDMVLYFKILLWNYGNIDIAKISYQSILEMRNKLLQMPVRFSDTKAFKGKDFDYVIKNRDKKKNLLSKITVNKYLQEYTTFFDYAIKCKYLTTNPATGTKTKISKLEKEISKVKPYTPDELEALEEIYKSESNENYLIFKIAKHSGMRLGEITQLQIKNIIEVDNTMCFQLEQDLSEEYQLLTNEQKKTIKNVSSIRNVPIHKFILNDILEFVKNRASNEFVFSINAKDYSRFFGRKIKSKLDYVGKKDFHSLRHNFINYLVQRDCRGEHIASIVGHTQALKMTYEQYANPLSPSITKPIVDLAYS